MNLLQALRGRGGAPVVSAQRMTLDEYALLAAQFSFNGLGYQGRQQTLVDDGGDARERGGESFTGLVQSAYTTNGVVFAVMLARQLAFSGVRFQWQRLNRGRPSELFGTPALEVLERPWPGGTTQDLLTRIINDADTAGAAYMVADTPLPRLGGDGGREVVRLRPDWVQVAMTPRIMGGARVGWRRVGYLYGEGGDFDDAAVFTAAEVAHFMPIIDPLASWRGMSWLTPVIREVRADHQMTRFKDAFFTNGATPSMIASYPAGVAPQTIEKVAELMADKHGGAENAFKVLHFGGGADVTLVGRDMKQVAFQELAGAAETRIAAAGRVSPVIVGLSEGLQGSALNAGNYGQARRQFADGTMHPLWGNVSGSLAPLVGKPPGPGVRLWYDAREVPFLREDEKDQAQIQSMEAATIRTLIDAGYTAESVQAAVDASDWGLLVHSGLFSVQLQPAGAQQQQQLSANQGVGA